MAWTSYSSIRTGYDIARLRHYRDGLEVEIASLGAKKSIQFSNLIEYRVSLESDVWISIPEGFEMPAGYSNSSRYIDDFISRCDPSRLPKKIFHSIFSDVAVVVEVLSGSLPELIE